MKTTRNEAEVRTYSKPSGHRKVAGIPVSLLAVVLIAGLAIAAIVALGPFSTPVSQTPQAIFAAAKTSGVEPAYGMIESTLGYGVVDHVLIQAWQTGYSSSQAIHLVIRIGGGGFTSCANAATYLADKDGVVGQLTFDLDPLVTSVPLIISSGTFAGGLCTIDSNVNAPTKTFSVTTTMTSAAKGSAFDMAWQYVVVPASAVTFEFQAEV